MSWSASFCNPSKLSDASAEIDRLCPSGEKTEETLQQFMAAKEAARLLLKTIPGPYVHLSLSGHANGVGFQKKEGYANDCINISIAQCTDS